MNDYERLRLNKELVEHASRTDFGCFGEEYNKYTVCKICNKAKDCKVCYDKIMDDRKRNQSNIKKDQPFTKAQEDWLKFHITNIVIEEVGAAITHLLKEIEKGDSNGTV